MPSVQMDINGPDWPLGFIDVVSPGTPVNIMFNVDQSLVAQGSTTNNPDSGVEGKYEYSWRCNQIIFQGFKPKMGGGTQVNTGNVYVCRTPISGPGGKGDTGCIVFTITPGAIVTLAVPALSVNSLSAYRYFLDADNAGEGAFVTLIIGG